MISLTPNRAESPHRVSQTNEDHPHEFIVEGQDRSTRVWRRIFVTAADKNAAISEADERGIDPELVREARSAERPLTGANAPQREFGFGGVMSFTLGIVGILSFAIAVLMRNESPSFALVVGILGAVLALYGVAGTTAFWVLSRANRDAR